MLWKHLIIAAVVPLFVLLVGTGCLKRKETITVASNGEITIELEYDGNPGELKRALTLPSSQPGWDVSRTLTKQGERDDEIVRATRTFARGKELPSSYVSDEDPDAYLEPTFPTTVEFERRRDGLYVHFRRAYTPRKWSYVHYWHEYFMIDDLLDLGDKELMDLEREERIEILKGVTHFEARKQVEFARAALAECDPDLPPDRWLLARRALLNVYEGIDYDQLMDLFEQVPEEDRDARLEQETDQVIEQAHDAFLASLRKDTRYNRAMLARFQGSFERAKRYYEITEETGGQLFEIRVKMPGRVVAHNADKVDDDGTAVWEFEGNAFVERPHELMITSRLDP